MEKISVLVRVRPLDKQEALKGSAWKITGNTISLSTQGTKFEFDRVFGEESETLDIYEARTKHIVAAAVQGFNGTVFAYGQTSSGKTHTMRGSPTEPGVIPLAVRDVFKNIEEAEDREFLLRMSYMEIYNEEINDLLFPEHRKLQVHESLERGIFVAGLREEIVASPEHVLQLMEFGESHRHIGETNMNVYSSRSHTIFRMVIESRDKNEDDSVGMSCDAVRVSVLNLVDLAGSERVAKTGAEGARLKEGSHINKSLMTLGTVINKLSEGVESQGGHVPYRDSKLTRILQPALGGNAKTAIICNITPALVHVDETKGTLQFASRALRVTNCAQVNEVLTDAALLKRQKKEIEELRAKLQGSHSEHLPEEILNLRNTLLQSELERERIALELQEEKKAQAERERQLKEQAQKIENLSTMVLYSAMDDREKRVKKNNRRETWCPNAPLKDFSQEEFIRPSKGAPGEIVPGRRDRKLPPPFQKLCEDPESSAHVSSKDSGSASGHEILKENANVSISWAECTLPNASAAVHVTDRKKKALVESMTLNEVRDELLELQTSYQDLECEYENQRKLKNSEIEDLKKRLAKAEAAANKQQKVNKLHLGQSTDRRGKSLTGWESEALMMNKQLEDEVKTLELEKLYMQRDLDRHLELAKAEQENAKRAFEQKEKEEGLDKIVSEFDELRIEVESVRSTANDVQSVAGDSVQAFSIAKEFLQEISRNVGDMKLEFHHIKMTNSLSECIEDCKSGDGIKSANVLGVIEDSAKDIEVGKRIVNDQSSTVSCSKSDLIPFSGSLCHDLKHNSQSTAQDPSGEEMLELTITESQIDAQVILRDPTGSQELPLLGQLDEGSMLDRREIVSSVLSAKTIDVPSGIEILAFLEDEKQHSMRLLGILRNLSQQEELLSDKLIYTSGLDEMVSELQRAMSESNRLINSIWMNGRSKSWSDIEVTEVHLANSRGMHDNCLELLNEMTLTPVMDSTFSEDQSKTDANTEILKQDTDILYVQEGGECGSFGASEPVQHFESDSAEVPNCDDMMTNRALSTCDCKVTASPGTDSRLATPHGQCKTRNTSSVQVDGRMDCLRGSFIEKNVNNGLDDVVEGLNAEIRSLRGKVESLEAELAMTMRERSRNSEGEAFVLKQLQSVQSALQLSNEEKEHLQEVHTQTLIKLQTIEKEIESHKHDLDAASKSLEQCNSEKKEAEEKICNLELFICQKIEEKNAFVNEHKITCEALMKRLDELEKEIRTSLSQQIEMYKMLTINHENTCAVLANKLEDLVTEKAAMADQISDGHQKLEELQKALESAKKVQEEQDREYNAEKTQMMTEVSALRKEVAQSSSSSIAKERERLRKELDKVKLKLKDTEAKLRNILQEKSKLEGEKANTDREIKLLRGQSSLLQRDISKRESLVDKRRESRACDLSKTKNQLGFLEQSLQLKSMELERANFDLEILQENYNKLERTLAEVQDKLEASEGELFVTSEEKETLASELDHVSEKLKVTSSELSSLHEQHAALNQQLHERENICKQLEDSLSVTLKEKEEIAMHLTDVFLQLEEEKALSSSIHKASVEVLKEEESRKLSIVNAEVSVLREDLQKLKMELESSKDQCKHLSEQLSLVEVNCQEERRASSLELDQLREDHHHSKAEHEISENAMRNTIKDLNSRAEALSLENDKISGEVSAIRNELERVNSERDQTCNHIAELCLRIEEANAGKLAALSEQAILKERYNEIQCKLISASDTVQALTERTIILEEQLAIEKLNFVKETTKLQVRLKTTRAKLDAFHGRYVEILDELTVMHRKFTEDSRKLKEQLVAARLESFELKKKLMAME